MTEYSTAVHEAGHAVMTVLVKRGLDYVTIKSSKDNPAHCSDKLLKEPKTEAGRKARLRKECLMLYSGIVAEKIMLGYENYWDGMLLAYSHTDRMKAQAAVEIFYGIDYDGDENDNEDEVNLVNNYIEGIWRKADAMFSDPLVQSQIKAVADALMDKQRLSGTKVRSIMKSMKAVA